MKLSPRARGFVRDFKRLLDILILLSCLLIVAVVSIEILNPLPLRVRQAFLTLQFWVCFVFLTDFFFRLATAEKPARFFVRHWFFLLVSVPYVNIAQWSGISLTPAMEWFLRIVPLLRGGYGVVIVVGWATRNRVTNLMVSYLIIMVALVWFSSLIFYEFERGVNPQVKHFSDAVWWALMHATMIGSNISPVTSVGRVLTFLVSLAGLMLFPIFTVYVSNKFQARITQNTGKKQPQAPQPQQE